MVPLVGEALATTGGGRRGWTIGGRWYGHVVDPWTGSPLPDRRSCTVLAASTAAADAAASAAAVLDDEDLERWADREELAVLRVSETGSVWRSVWWRRTVVERSPDGDPDQADRQGRQGPGGPEGAPSSLSLEDLDADAREGDEEQEDR